MQSYISAARGELKADLLIRDCQLVNVLSGEIHKSDLAFYQGLVLGFEEVEAREVIQAEGRYLCPGLIDGHIHIESTLLSPVEFARIAAQRGTSAVIWDPHEIANVQGKEGVEHMLALTQDLPVQFYFMLPSCVPATHLETSGASLDPEDIQDLLQKYPERVLGLAEVMNYPGVLMQDEKVLKKIAAAKSRVIDGHCPGLLGKGLDAYILAGPGSDHESCFLEEGLEKLRKGMHLMIREGSSAKNLKDLLPIMSKACNPNISLVTDDRHPDDLLHKGHMDHILRLAIELGADPVRAVQAASINTARYFGLKRRGALAPGYRADAVLLSSLERFEIDQVFCGGEKLALSQSNARKEKVRAFPLKVKELSLEDFYIHSREKKNRVKAIQILPGQILTKAKVCTPRIEDSKALPDPDQDLSKLAVLERHKASGNMGLGFVSGLGLKSGAVGSTVAHDSHNLILAGTNDTDLLLAARHLVDQGGGLVVVSKGRVLAGLDLPLAGLMSDESIETVSFRLESLQEALAELGVSREFNLFMHLSFLALPVIPELRLTDQGLVDVNEFAFTSLWAD